MTKHPQNLLGRLEDDTGLFELGQLRRRLDALDQLDALSDLDEPSERGRVAKLRHRLETANAAIYKAIRDDIRQNGRPESLLRWIHCCRGDGESEHPEPGLGYDALDELIAGALEIPEPGELADPLQPEQVFYQPTPVRHMLAMIGGTKISSEDVLVDFGSGLGQLCITASILTGARTIGIEIEEAYARCAQMCAQNLALSRVDFICVDARQADLSTGTVFHLYTPFTGSILRTVLDRIREQAKTRPLRISALGPCTEVVAQESWLEADTQARPDQISVFRSNL